MVIVDLSILCLLGTAGWMLFKRARIPSPALLGSLLVIGIIRGIGLEIPASPPWFSKLTQILLGFYMGSTLTKDSVEDMRGFLVPTILVPVWYLSFNFLAGWLTSSLTGLNYSTAFLAVSAGGITEMVIVAMEIGADVLSVALLQTLRVIVFMTLYPLALNKLMKNGWVSEMEIATIDEESHDRSSLPRIGLAFLLSIAGGMLLVRWRVPAGGMLGALLTMGVLNLLVGLDIRVNWPPLLSIVLVGVGITIGDSITPATARALFSPELFPTIVLVLSLSTISALILTYFVKKFTGWDWVTCALACAPVGFSSMPVLAMEYNRDPLYVSTLQFSRLFTLKAAIPLLAMWLF